MGRNRRAGAVEDFRIYLTFPNGSYRLSGPLFCPTGRWYDTGRDERRRDQIVRQTHTNDYRRDYHGTGTDLQYRLQYAQEQPRRYLHRDRRQGNQLFAARERYSEPIVPSGGRFFCQVDIQPRFQPWRLAPVGRDLGFGLNPHSRGIPPKERIRRPRHPAVQSFGSPCRSGQQHYLFHRPRHRSQYTLARDPRWRCRAV